ncbi:hypothetical protein BISA_0212 [Bifidobacterium saguini DSM 23967]|uniref:Uncharacterized protein n=2 Tax=Bifidobacterium saguini TaxID=762210 RepID=A0A087DF74_9BIFI|nr:hypothetical protein BISA_0212 [Bifidobacterium saguini DSM 23967]
MPERPVVADNRELAGRVALVRRDERAWAAAMPECFAQVARVVPDYSVRIDADWELAGPVAATARIVRMVLEQAAEGNSAAGLTDWLEQFDGAVAVAKVPVIAARVVAVVVAVAVPERLVVARAVTGSAEADEATAVLDWRQVGHQILE